MSLVEGSECGNALEERLAAALAQLKLGLPPTELSRAYTAVLAVVQQQQDGQEVSLAAVPCDLCEVPPDRLLTEVEACWLQLERRLQTADDEVVHVRRWLELVVLPLVRSKRTDLGPVHDAIARGFHVTASRPASEELGSLLEGAALEMLREVGQMRDSDREGEEGSSSAALGISCVTSYLRGYCDRPPPSSSSGPPAAAVLPWPVLSASLALLRSHPCPDIRTQLVCSILPAMAPFLAPPDQPEETGGEEGQRGAVTGMLEQIWALVLHMRDTPRERRDLWAVLCVLYDALVEPLGLPAKPEFWALVEQGLCSPCSLTRKRTLHLLERYLDSNSAEQPQQEAAAPNGPSKAASSSSSSSKKRGQPPVDPVVRWWRELLVAVSTFETEYEGHLAEQTWPLLMKVLAEVTRPATDEGEAGAETQLASLVQLPGMAEGRPAWCLPKPSWPWAEAALRRSLGTACQALKKRYLMRLVDGTVPLLHCLGLLSEPFMFEAFMPLAMDVLQTRHSHAHGIEDLPERTAAFLAGHMQRLADRERRERFLLRLLRFCGERNWSNYALVVVLQSMQDPSWEGPEGGGDWACLGTEGLLAVRSFLVCATIKVNNNVQRRLMTGALALLDRFTDYSQHWRAISYQSVGLLLVDLPAPLLVTDCAPMVQRWLDKLQRSSGLVVEQTAASLQAYVTGDPTLAEGNGPDPSTGPAASLESQEAEARQLAVLCAFMAGGAEVLGQALGGTVLSTLAKAHSHPYLPPARLRRALLVLHHMSKLALLSSRPQPSSSSSSSPSALSLPSALAHVLGPISDELMSFLTATAAAHLLPSAPPHHENGTDGPGQQQQGGARVVASSDLLEELRVRALHLNVLGHVVRLLADGKRSVRDSAVSVVVRALQALFDLNERQRQGCGDASEAVLARVQAAGIIERVLASAPASLQASLLEHRADLQRALLGLSRGERVTDSVRPSFGGGGGVRSSGVLLQMASDRCWRCLALLQQLAPPTAPPTAATGDDDSELDAVVLVLCESLDCTSRRSALDLLSMLCRLLPTYACRPLTRSSTHREGAAVGEDVQAEVSGRVEALWAVVRRLLHEVKLRPLVCVLVIHSFFCPALLALPWLSSTPEAPLRRLWQELLQLAMEDKHHILVNLVARCIAVWESEPLSCVHYRAEIAELLIFKEDEPDFTNVADAMEEEQQLQVTACRLPCPLIRLSLLYLVSRLHSQPHPPETAAALRGLTDELVVQLLEWDQQSNETNSWTPGTPACNRKLKIWQALTALSHSLHEGLMPRVNQLLWPLLERFSVLHVRYHVEVFVGYVVHRFPDLMWPLLIEQMRDFRLKPQIITSRLCMAGHAAFSEGADPLPIQRQAELVAAMLPWLGCTHGYCRILSQLFIHRLLPAVIDHEEQQQQRLQQQLDGPGTSSSSSRLDLQYLRSVMAFLSEHREIVRMRAREVKAFEASTLAHRCSFHGLLEHEINDWREIAPKHMLEELQEVMTKLHDELLEEDGAFAEEGLPTDDGRKGGEQHEGEGGDGVMSVQRKIITSDVLGLTAHDKQRLDNTNARGKPKQSVIVCATLVDKVPNLAGLARTCEVFAASKLVMPNARLTELEMFQTISAAAAPHLAIEEVKPKDLVSFLRRCQRDGYTIVGLEQTSTSVSLQHVSLPRRCVLLLGAEKEGIPVDLLQEVDRLVEIPQLGITRSLNVHVSGALLLWEYTRQHAQLSE